MRAKIFLQGLIAFLIVAFGQPSFSVLLAPIAAAVGFALFWHAIRIYPFKRQRFWRATLWYGAVSIIQLSWMSAIEYQGIYILLVWLGLSIGLGLQFGLLSILIPYKRHLNFPCILAIASVWTLLEWSRYHFICGYSWNLCGIALSHVYAIQLGAVFGILGLTFWVMMVNLLGLRAFLRKGIVHYLIWGGAVCLPYLFGFCHISYHDAQIAKRTDLPKLSCALVQTGLLPPEKTPIQGKIRAFINPYDQWKRILFFLKEEGKSHFDLIVLPEAVVPLSSGTAFYDRNKVETVFLEIFGSVPASIFPEGDSDMVSNVFWSQSLSNIFSSEVVIGLDHVEPDGKSYNSAFHFKPFDSSASRYDKQVLMPLAEYLPFRFLAPLVKSYGIADFFTPGDGAKLFHGKVPMAVSICYEETFPHKIREGRLLGAKLLVNVTNDGWYPYSRLPSQHFEHAKFRAVENGVALVRACNTGVSAVVDSLGRTVGRLEECGGATRIQTGVLSTQITAYEYSTLFSLWGNGGIVCLSLLFLVIFAIFKKELD
ncbi:MAG: Apolipoprotein N-acyltransferase [Chlamydiae bacterium]|nr:Apolipoprotein N-acyltransferase [Chlamydiota bacterium]